MGGGLSVVFDQIGEKLKHDFLKFFNDLSDAIIRFSEKHMHHSSSERASGRRPSLQKKGAASVELYIL